MFHGGTNFGFMNGANEGLGATNEGGSGEPYAATCTSYGQIYFVSLRRMSLFCTRQYMICLLY